MATKSPTIRLKSKTAIKKPIIRLKKKESIAEPIEKDDDTTFTIEEPEKESSELQESSEIGESPKLEDESEKSELSEPSELSEASELSELSESSKPNTRSLSLMGVEFDREGKPKANKKNVDLMTSEQLENACRKDWNLENYINPLIVELNIDLPSKASKIQKCLALMEYKKNQLERQQNIENPDGKNTVSKDLKTKVKSKDIYEAFNWMTETQLTYRGKTWTLQHSPKFRREITDFLSPYRLSDTSKNLLNDEPDSPYKYQMIPVSYLDPSTPFRSSVAFHGLGSGKTRTAVMTSIRFIEDGKKVLFLIPGALRQNVLEELYRWGPKGVKIENYDSLSSDEKREAEKASNRIIPHYYDILTYNERGLLMKLNMLVDKNTGFLHDRLIIIDEVHDFTSRLSKPGNQSRRVYHFMMDKLINCKILALSGTPLLNVAYELAVLFNILRGKMLTDYTLFPEVEEEFNMKFVDYVDRSVNNRVLFQRRISGLVSYYAGTTDLSTMPEKRVMPVDIVEMSDHQYGLYLSERYSENKKEQRRAKGKGGKQSGDAMTSSSSGSAFRTYSRMVSNFAFPEEIIRPKPISSNDFRSFNKFKDYKIKDTELFSDVKDEVAETTKDPMNPDDEDGFEPDTKDLDTDLNKVDPEEEIAVNSEGKIVPGEEKAVLSKKQRQLTYLKMLDMAFDHLKTNSEKIFSNKGLKIYSPKLLKMYQNIETGAGNEGLIYIYTEFRVLEGVRIIGLGLEHSTRGYVKLPLAQIQSFDDVKALGKAKRYGIISSEEDVSQRKRMMQILKHPENSHGEYCKIVLGTAASSQGINLKRIRQIHVTEEYWNKIREEQVEGRGVRLESHTDLPKDEQNVYIYKYRSILTPAQQKDAVSKLDNTSEMNSTEEYLHNLATTKQVINAQFLRMMKESAYDFNVNFLVNVKKDPELKPFDVPEEFGEYMYVPNIENEKTDGEYGKHIKYEVFLPAKKVIKGVTYGYKVYKDGKPILTELVIDDKVYSQVIVFYDYELLLNNIEIKQKYFVLGLNKLYDINDTKVAPAPNKKNCSKNGNCW